MKKVQKAKSKLIPGTALLLSCCIAHAQSSVTLYGVVDGGLLYNSKTLNTTTGQNSGHAFSVADSGTDASEFGLTGTENLGGGLKASFKLESGISVANGGYNDSNGNLFGRQAWAALGGNFGEVKVGLQYSPFFRALDASDPRDFSKFGSGITNYVDNVFVTGLFNSNAVTYTSPTLAGFTGIAMLALGGEAGNFQAGRQYSASLKYEGTGLMVNAAIYDGNRGGTIQTAIPSTIAFEGRTIGAAYTFGGLTAKASFVNYKVAGSFNNNVYGGGVNYFVSPYLRVNGGVWFTSDRNDTTNNSVLGAVGAEYSASRATTFYVQTGLVHNHGVMNTGLSISDTSLLYAVPGTTVAVNVGIRHLF